MNKEECKNCPKIRKLSDSDLLKFDTARRKVISKHCREIGIKPSDLEAEMDTDNPGEIKYYIGERLILVAMCKLVPAMSYRRYKPKQTENGNE